MAGIFRHGKPCRGVCECWIVSACAPPWTRPTHRSAHGGKASRKQHPPPTPRQPVSTWIRNQALALLDDAPRQRRGHGCEEGREGCPNEPSRSRLSECASQSRSTSALVRGKRARVLSQVWLTALHVALRRGRVAVHASLFGVARCSLTGRCVPLLVRNLERNTNNHA